MYYHFFITYIIGGFVFCLVVFFWALKNGQFSDQQRARYLPLEPESEPPIGQIHRAGQLQSYVLLGLLIFGLLAGVSVVIYAYLI
jgi:cbb3-type cytochrome oxidase maturation protein